MKLRRLAVLAIPVAIFAASRVVRRRRPSLLRLLRLHVGVTHADWLDNATGLFGSIFGGISGAVKDFVRGVVRTAVNWLLDLINSVVGMLSGAVLRVTTTVASLSTSLFSAINGVIQRIADAAAATLHKALDFASGIGRMLQSAIDTVWRWARDAVAGALRALDSLRQWVTDHVLRPFLNFVGGIYSWIRDNIWNPLWRLIQEGAQRLTQVWDWVWDKVNTLFRWVDSVAGPIIDVVRAAWDWLVFLGRWTFRAIEELIRSTAILGPQYLMEQARILITREGALLEDMVVRWLG